MAMTPSEKRPDDVVDLDELFPFAWGKEEPCSECGDPTYLCNQWGRVVCRQCWAER